MTLPPSLVGKKLPRIVIVSDNASMEMSGETSTQLYYFKHFLSWGVETYVVVHERCEEELRATLPPEQFARFFFVPDTHLMRWVHRIFKRAPDRIRSLIGAQIIHILTGLKSRKIVKQLASDGKIDVVFESTPISPKAISCMYNVGVPLVVGPLCGGLSFPPAFQFMDSRSVAWTVGITRIVSHALHRLMPGKLQAKVLVVGNQRAAAALPKGIKGKVIEVVESGVDLTKVNPVPFPRRSDDEPARFVYFARFVDWKGVEYLVEAFPKVLKHSHAVLELIGDGDLLEPTKSQVERLGIRDHVNFYGRLPLNEGIDIISKSDAYMATGLRECGGLALLEAMGTATPVIACNWMAPGVYVTDDCGIRVDVTTRETFVDGLADAMIRIANDKELQTRLSEGAAQRVRSNYFDWKSKSARILEILSEVAAGKCPD